MKKLFFSLSACLLSVILAYGQFQVTLVLPANGENQAQRNANIFVVFNNDPDPVTVNSSSLRVYGSYSGLIQGDYVVINHILYFEPEHDFWPGETVSVSVTTSLEDQGHNQLQEAFHFSFVVKTESQDASSVWDAIVIDEPGTLQSADPADIDNDGDLDIVVLGGGFLKWYENTGDYNFQPHIIDQNMNVMGSDPAIGDLDGDGDLDIVLATNMGSIDWYESDGQANPGFMEHSRIGFQKTDYQTVFLYDMDTDGDLDILPSPDVIIQFSDHLKWFENRLNSNNSFVSHQLSSQAPGHQKTTAADVNDDGEVDVITALSDGEIVYYQNQGNGQYSEDTIATDFGGFGRAGLQLVDLNNDKRLDIVASSLSGNQILWYQADPNEPFGFRAAQVISGAVTEVTSMLCVDIDNDGDMDVLTSSRADSEIMWYKNNGNNSFNPRAIDDDGLSNAFYISTGDMNGDGDLEVIAINKIIGQSDQLIIYETSDVFYNACNQCNVSDESDWNTRRDGTGEQLPNFSSPSTLIIQAGDLVELEESENMRLYHPESELILEENARLDIRPDAILNLAGGMENNGAVYIVSPGSLVQTSQEDLNPHGNGFYLVYRESRVLADSSESMMWSSPVEAAVLSDAFPATNDFSYYRSYFNPGRWWPANPLSVMTPGLAYSFRGPSWVSNSSLWYHISGNRVNNGDVNLYSNAVPGAYIGAGNPYPSAIDMDMMVLDNPDISGTFLFWDGLSYAWYTPMGSIAGGLNSPAPDGTISSCQGFFVQAGPNGADSLYFKNSHRVGYSDGNSQFYKKEENDKERIWLNLTNQEDGFSQILIGFTEEATDGKDKYDAAAFKYTAPVALYSKLEGKDYVIQGLSKIKGGEYKVIELLTEATEPGQHKIAIDSLHNWPDNYRIHLVDTKNQSETDLRESGSYSFEVKHEETEESRFFLKIGEFSEKDRPGHTNLKDIEVFQAGGALKVDMKTSQLSLKGIEIFTLSGQRVFSERVAEGTQYADFSVRHLPTGIYMVGVLTANGLTEFRKTQLK